MTNDKKQNERKELPEMITTKQAADLLGVTTQRIRVLANDGRLTAKKFGHIWMIDRDSVYAFTRYAPYERQKEEDESN